MKKILIMILLCSGMNSVFAASHSYAPSNSMITDVFSTVMNDNNITEDSWDMVALRSVLQESSLFKMLVSMDNALPITVKTSKYVMALNEMHQMNHNLELILQELQKINDKL